MRWLRERARLWWSRRRHRVRRWLGRQPRLRRLLQRAGCLDVDELALARGVAVGLFVGLTPTLGVQTLILIAASLALRANFPAAFLASWVNNPLTVAPLYFGMNRLGQVLLDVLPVKPPAVHGLEDEIVDEAAALIVGSLVVAVPVALLAYVGFLATWHRLKDHGSRKRDDGDSPPPRL